MTATYEIDKLAEVTVCPACGDRVHIRDYDGIEFFCGSTIGRDPRKDPKGRASLDVECDYDAQSETP